MRKLSIVIPCFNERDHVAELLTRVFAVTLPDGWEREVIVVDDASSDGTPDVLRALDLPLRLVFRQTNGGKGTALHDGFNVATGTHIIIQDADLEYDPNDIPSLLDAIEDERTVVYGSRYLREGGKRGAFILRAGVWALTGLINVLFGARLTDTSTCYKLFPREAAQLLPHGGLEADSVFAAILLRAGYRIREIPISYAPRTIAEGKKMKYRYGFKALISILRLYIKR
jgi:glycosyltransferase involved in cell wall biosynthesis